MKRRKNGKRKDFHVTISLRNNHMYSRRVEYGLSQKAMAEVIGISTDHYGKLERCQFQIGKDGGWSDPAIACAEYFDVPIEELFPESVCRVSENRVERTVDGEAVMALASMSLTPEENLFVKERRQLVEGVMGKLRPREERLIRQRYGFLGDEKTLVDMGREMGISSERVRQMEQKALRKLRHPSALKYLKQFFPKWETNNGGRDEKSDLDSTARLRDEYNSKVHNQSLRREKERRSKEDQMFRYMPPMEVYRIYLTIDRVVSTGCDISPETEAVMSRESIDEWVNNREKQGVRMPDWARFRVEGSPYGCSAFLTLEIATLVQKKIGGRVVELWPGKEGESQ